MKAFLTLILVTLAFDASAFHEVKRIGTMADGHTYLIGYWGATGVILKGKTPVDPNCNEIDLVEYWELKNEFKYDGESYSDPRYDYCKHHTVIPMAEGNFFLGQTGSQRYVLDLNGKKVSNAYFEISCAKSTKSAGTFSCKGKSVDGEETFFLRR